MAADRLLVRLLSPGAELYPREEQAVISVVAACLEASLEHRQLGTDAGATPLLAKPF